MHCAPVRPSQSIHRERVGGGRGKEKGGEKRRGGPSEGREQIELKHDVFFVIENTL